MNQFPFDIILSWYKKHGRKHLPWREYHNAKGLDYRVWLSEIMLQQTQANRVIEYYERCLESFPTIYDLSELNWEEFFPYYQGLGYYNRGRNMLMLAQEIVSKYSGMFPTTYEELTDLPGIGPYTAQAIMSFAQDQNILSLDTNLQKIFSRYYHGSRFHKLTKTEIQEIQDMFLATNISGRDMNNALMDFASLVSINSLNKMEWDDYPLNECQFYKTKGEQEIKEKPKKLKSTFDRKTAEIVVEIHEGHKVYFSQKKDIYTPWRLAPTDLDHRKYIQDWFAGMYDIEISVRPPHTKKLEGDTVVFMYFGQVQSGSTDFSEWTKQQREKEML